MAIQGVKVLIDDRVPIGNLLGRTNFEQSITVLYDRVAFGLTKGKDVRSRNNWRFFRVCDGVVRSNCRRAAGLFVSFIGQPAST